MSELKVDKVSPRTGNYVALNTVGSKNIVINGDMSIAQRSTSTASVTGDGYHTVDRFDTSIITMGAFTQSQDTDVPTGQGFAKSLKMDCTTADAAPAAGDRIFIRTMFEGQNLQYLKKGTSNATSLTLSFWVKSNKTGTYTTELYDNDNTRQISKTYTIDSASTWEKKTITFAGDTTGALDNDNAASLQLVFWLGAGTNYTSGTLSTTWTSSTTANRVSSSQVNIADNTANEWLITGIQLEAGTTASDFEFLPYDMNLQRCFRYYEVIADGTSLPITNAAAYSSTKAYGIITFNTSKRTTPSLDQVSGTNFYRMYNNNTNDTFDDFQITIITKERARLNNTDDIAVTAGHAGWFETNNASCYVALDAEL